MARQGKGTVLGGRGRGTERRVESRRRETGIRVEMVGAPLDESDKKKDGGSRDTFLFRKQYAERTACRSTDADLVR